MKRLFIILMLIFLTSCSFKSGKTNGVFPELNAMEASERGFVVLSHGGQYNIEKIEEFYLNYLDKKKAQVTVVSFTTEGHPVYIHLNYNGNHIKYTFDNTWDRFGPKDKGPQDTSCQEIKTSQIIVRDRNLTQYFLSNCKDNVGLYNLDTNEILIATIFESNLLN